MRYIFIFVLALIMLSSPIGMAKDVDLRQHLEMLIAERIKNLDLRFEAAELAVKIASENLQRELSKLNELRQEVVKDRSLFVTNDYFTSKMASLDKEIAQLRERQIATETKAATWVIALGVFFAIIQLTLSYLTKRKSFRREDC
jgi:hypothetical protein